MSKLVPIGRRTFLHSLALNTWFFSNIALAQSVNTFKPFSFVFISDCHLVSGVSDSYKLTQESQLFLQQAIKQINILNPDFVVFGGDQVESPGDENKNWQLFLDIMQMLNCPWYFIMGEADISGNDPVDKMRTYGRDWQSLGVNNGKPYWSSDQFAGVHLIGLDTSAANSSIGYISNEQLDWLKSELSRSTAALTLVFSHHPLLIPAPYDQNGNTDQYLLVQADAVRDILNASGKQILALNGHIHISKIVKQNNVSYISCPSLDVYPCAFRHFQVDPQNIEIKTHQIDFPELVKKAKTNLLASSLAAQLTNNHPKQFANLALGSAPDRETSLVLAGNGMQ